MMEPLWRWRSGTPFTSIGMPDPPCGPVSGWLVTDTRGSNKEASVSTLAGPAISTYPALNAKQRESLIQRVSNAVEERIWDPEFQRERWRDTVGECRDRLLDEIDMAEFEQRMDALVRRAGDFVSVKSRDLGFFHKSRRNTHPSHLASHFRYCQPN